MSYIVRSGNLAGPATLTTDDQGRTVAHATVIVNDQARDRDGAWQNLATIAYRLTVHGRAATRLAEFQTRNGNKKILFAGTYRARVYTAPDGTTRLSHDVFVDHIGADLAALDLQVIAPTPDAEPDPHTADAPAPTHPDTGAAQEDEPPAYPDPLQ
jgi:single-stranded DNA-binding protein